MINNHSKYDVIANPAELKSHPKNRNKHSPEQIDRLADLYKFHGIRHPIIVSKRSGFIVAGHGRRDAAIKLKLKKFPVVYQNFASETAEYAFLQADNAIALWAEIDLAAIKLDLPDLDADFDTAMLGIKNLDSASVEGETDPDAVPEARKKAKTVLGDVYRLGAHRLMCGDSTVIDSVAKLMAGEKADLWLTDPPYGVGYVAKNASVNASAHGIVLENAKGNEIFNDEKSLDELRPFWRDAAASALVACTDEAAYYWFACQGGDQMTMMMMLGEAGWLVKHELIWVKSTQVFGRCDYHYRHEPIIYGWKKKGRHRWFSDRKQTSVLEYGRPQRSDMHPTTKPVGLIEYLMGNNTKKGQRVLDTFGGSGTTLIAAEKTGRKCFMMELDPVYCDVIVQRWEDFTGKKAVLENGKQLPKGLKRGESKTR